MVTSHSCWSPGTKVPVFWQLLSFLWISELLKGLHPGLVVETGFVHYWNAAASLFSLRYTVQCLILSTLTSKLEFKSKMTKAEYELIHSFNEWDRIWPAEIQSEIYEFIDFQSGVQVQTPRFFVPNPTPRPRSAPSTTFSFTAGFAETKKNVVHMGWNLELPKQQLRVDFRKKS